MGPMASPILCLLLHLSTLLVPASAGWGENLQDWCVAKTTADPAVLQSALDWVCGPGGADCSPIQQGGSCSEPSGVKEYASYAFNDHYVRSSGGRYNCDFSGTAKLTFVNPSRDNCFFPSRKAVERGAKWCVAKKNAKSETLQAALDWTCGPGGTDCRPIQQGGPCFEPVNVHHYASYAFHDYFIRHGSSLDACDFSGTATLTFTDPSRDSCNFTSRIWGRLKQPRGTPPRDDLADVRGRGASLHEELVHVQDGGEMCVICIERPRAHAFLPCGHRLCCQPCAEVVKTGPRSPRCPLCRRRVDSSIRIYDS